MGLQWQDSAPCCPSLAGVALPVAGIAPVQRRVVSGQRGVLCRARGRLKKEAAITAGGALCRAGGGAVLWAAWLRGWDLVLNLVLQHTADGPLGVCGLTAGASVFASFK